MNYLITLNIDTDVIHPNTRASFLHAARRWGCQYYEILQPKAPESGFKGAWAEKLFLDEHLPHNGRFLYLDGDCVIRHDCPNPFEIVPSKIWAWVRNNIPSHACTHCEIESVLPNYLSSINVCNMDIAKQYCNSGFMLFELPFHKAIWDLAKSYIRKTGFSTDWRIADQGPICAALHASDAEVLYLSSMFNLFGRELWENWTPSMKSGIYHFCGPISKQIGCGKTIWDETGPDRILHEANGRSVCRWSQGKPRALLEGPEISMLIREFSKIYKGVIVEVGVCLGGTTWYGARAAADSYSRYICVDHWRGASDLAVGESEYRAFLANMEDAGLSDSIEIFKMPSVEAASKLPDESVDLIFIDGDHSREGCSVDIKSWWPKLKLGGVMMGHDYSHKHFPDVIASVGDCFTTPDEISEGNYAIWKIVKTHHSRLND